MAMIIGRKVGRGGVWIVSFAAAAWTLCVGASAADDLNSFFSDGKVLFNARYRYESVQQTGFAKDAVANTVRVRAGFETAKQWDIQGLVEFVATEHLSNAFNDTVNGRSAYPAIPDPETLALNRFQILYTGVPDTALAVGRQVINLDDQRFVGTVAFRQNEQTFDAVRLSNNSIPNLTLNYIYLDQVNRVFGERSLQGHFHGDVHLFDAAYSNLTVGGPTTIGSTHKTANPNGCRTQSRSSFALQSSLFIVFWPQPTPAPACYPAQHESLVTSFANASAASFNPSTVVR